MQERFWLEKRAGFLRVLELLLRQSGGMLVVTRLAAESQISRPTVTNWLEIYQITHVVHLLHPFSAGGRREIVTQPMVFGFDSGRFCRARGWDYLSHFGAEPADQSSRPPSITAALRNGVARSSLSKISTWGSSRTAAWRLASVRGWRATSFVNGPLTPLDFRL